MATLNTFIVEDSPLLLGNLTAALEELAPVRVVGSAEEEDAAVAWISDHRTSCDVLIIDIFLKRGSGLGVLQAASALHGDMCLIVLSNYATVAMRRRCLDLGAHRVFDKSSEIDELVAYCASLAASGATPHCADPRH